MWKGRAEGGTEREGDGNFLCLLSRKLFLRSIADFQDCCTMYVLLRRDACLRAFLSSLSVAMQGQEVSVFVGRLLVGRLLEVCRAVDRLGVVVQQRLRVAAVVAAEAIGWRGRAEAALTAGE